MDLQLAERPRHVPAPDQTVVEKLEQRLGRLHTRQRLGIEADLEGRIFGRGINFFHPENWSRSAPLIRTALKLTGLYWRARQNAERIQIRRHEVVLDELPTSFDC